MADRNTPDIYEMTLPDFNIADESSIEAVLGQLDNAMRAPHLRLLSYIMPIIPQRFESIRRRQMAQLQHEIGRLYMEEEVRVLRTKLETHPSWEMRHFLLSWGQPIRAISQWLKAGVTPPDPIPGRYEEEAEYWRPLDNGGKFVKIMGTYEFRTGPQWSWWEPWGSLVTQADGPMILALDAERLSTTAVRLARRGLENQLKATKSHDEDMAALVEAAKISLQTREDFYRMRFFIMLRDTNLTALMERAERIKQTYEATLAFSLLPGQQATALRFFSERAKPPMPTDSHHTVLASALPVAFGGLGGMVSRFKVDGIYLGFRVGLGRQSLGPVYLQGWKSNNAAYHMGILGSTGGGKSVFVMAALAREFAVNDTAICFIDPMGNSGKLAALLGRDPRVHLHKITWKGIRLNPMDYVGESEPEQTDHLHALIQVMLNRRLDNIERSLLSRAAKNLYDRFGITPQLVESGQPFTPPLLGDFCVELKSLNDPQADYMARELDGMYVSTGYGTIFNAQTNLDLDFDGATLYDVEEVAGQESSNETFKTILYYIMFASLIRTARRGKQAGGGLRRRILAIDEYYYLARNQYLAARMVDMIKTARNRGMGVWFCEQNLATFSGLRMEGGDNVDLSSGSGHLMMSNVDKWMIFKQGDKEANLLRREFPSRCPPAFANWLPSATVGQCVAMLSTAPLQTYVLDVNLLPSEREMLAPAKKTSVGSKKKIAAATA